MVDRVVFLAGSSFTARLVVAHKKPQEKQWSKLEYLSPIEGGKSEWSQKILLAEAIPYYIPFHLSENKGVWLEVEGCEEREQSNLRGYLRSELLHLLLS